MSATENLLYLFSMYQLREMTRDELMHDINEYIDKLPLKDQKPKRKYTKKGKEQKPDVEPMEICPSEPQAEPEQKTSSDEDKPKRARKRKE